MIYSPNLYPFILSHGAPTDGFPIPPSKEQVAEGLMEEIAIEAKKEGHVLTYTVSHITQTDGTSNMDVDLHIVCDEPTARFIEDLEYDISPATGSKLNWWRSEPPRPSKVKIRMDYENKAQADALIAMTPLKTKDVSARGLWTYTMLFAAGVPVGSLCCNRTNDPLHIDLDLTALMAHDEDWQTTLETLGVLR